MQPLIDVWTEFRPIFREEFVEKGIMCNKKLLDQKIEETKNLIMIQEKEKEEEVPVVQNEEDKEEAEDGEQENNNNVLANEKEETTRNDKDPLDQLPELNKPAKKKKKPKNN